MSDHHAAPGAHGQDHGDTGHAGGGDAGHGGGHDEHGHEGMGLGPIDWRMWGVGVLGVIAALIVTAGMVVATTFSFSA